MKRSDFIIRAGIAALALTGPQSLRADFNRDLLEVYATTSLEDVRPLIENGKKSGQPEAYYFSGRLAMLDFNFPQAQKDFAEYSRLAKARKLTTYNAEVAEAQKWIKEGNLQFDRFQDIAVIDAINVDKEKFFRYLRLPLSAGRIVEATEIPGNASQRGEAGYISESGDFMMWTEWVEESDPADEEGSEKEGYDFMMEATRLTDGSISEPKRSAGFGESPDYPFLTADGTTLYYSAYGDNSVGERDIFIATRDPQTGDYRQPVNAGMPFNSAADDYLLAVDEENGVGWWATDRHLLGDKVTLYVFMLPEGRRNFGGSVEEKRARGVLDDIRVTWLAPDLEDSEDDEEDAEEKTEEQLAQEQAAREKGFRAKAAEIREIRPGQKPRRQLCRIPLKGGKFIYSPDDVNTPAQKRLVEEYIESERVYAALAKELDSARRNYSSKASDALGNEILRLEKEEERQRASRITILSDLYRELGYR